MLLSKMDQMLGSVESFKTELRGETADLKGDVSELKGDVSKVGERLGAVEDRVERGEQRTARIEECVAQLKNKSNENMEEVMDKVMAEIERKGFDKGGKANDRFTGAVIVRVGTYDKNGNIDNYVTREGAERWLENVDERPTSRRTTSN